MKINQPRRGDLLGHSSKISVVRAEELKPSLQAHCSIQSPNGWRLSGDHGAADGVRCSRGLGDG